MYKKAGNTLGSILKLNMRLRVTLVTPKYKPLIPNLHWTPANTGQHLHTELHL